MTSTDNLTGQPVPPPRYETSWLAIAAMLADLAFETDRDGRFTSFGPGKVLGGAPTRLLGAAAAGLFLPSYASSTARDPAAALNVIIAAVCQECVAWQGRVRLAGKNGGLYRLSLAPRINDLGKVSGTYGLLFALEGADLVPTASPPAGGQADALLDGDTGFWLAKTFTDEAARRFDRLDVEELPGTLIFLGFARAPAPMHRAIAMRMAEELRDIVRPTDLLGRINATTIALWCDGMDHLTGGERAARFCGRFPGILPERTMVTAGLATRWPGSGDDPHTVVERASVALRLADLATERETAADAVGAWRVWQND
jgi:hypothetical protein